jgi:nucleoside-diphosphate-sugar epimerase
LITGAAGMIGRKLTERLVLDGSLGGAPIGHLVLADAVLAEDPHGAPFGIDCVQVDTADPRDVGSLAADRPDVVFHLAAVVSGEAEADLEKGYRVNLDGTRLLLEAIRADHGHRPRLVFASSIAVFGAPFPDEIGDDFHTTPLTSYGTQKAVCELLLNDYTRRGFVDGVAIRLPTICVRPGAANLAASGFFSEIIREPLNGREAVVPVALEVRHWHASPRAAVEFLLHAATIDGSALGARRCLTMPGVSVTVGEQLEALAAVAGNEVAQLVRYEPDEGVERFVAGWPRSFDARRAESLGFRAESSFEEIIRIYIDDELGGRIPAVGR